MFETSVKNLPAQFQCFNFLKKILYQYFMRCHDHHLNVMQIPVDIAIKKFHLGIFFTFLEHKYNDDIFGIIRRHSDSKK